MCDGCGVVMPQGSSAVAESVPSNMGNWEHEYFQARLEINSLIEPWMNKVLKKCGARSKGDEREGDANVKFRKDPPERKMPPTRARRGVDDEG